MAESNAHVSLLESGLDYRKIDQRLNDIGAGVEMTIYALRDSGSRTSEYIKNHISRRGLVGSAFDLLQAPYQGVKSAVSIAGEVAAEGLTKGAQAVNLEKMWNKGIDVRIGKNEFNIGRRLASKIEDRVLGKSIGKRALEAMSSVHTSGNDVTQAMEHLQEKDPLLAHFVNNQERILNGGNRDTLQRVQRILNVGDMQGEALVEEVSRVIRADPAFENPETRELADLLGGITPELAKTAIKTGVAVGAIGKAMSLFGATYSGLRTAARMAENVANKETRAKTIERFKLAREKVGLKGALAGLGAGMFAAMGADKLLKDKALSGLVATVVASTESLNTKSETKESHLIWAFAQGMGLYNMITSAEGLARSTGAEKAIEDFGIKATVAAGHGIGVAIRGMEEIGSAVSNETKVVIASTGRELGRVEGLFFKDSGHVFGVFPHGKVESECSVREVNARGHKVGDDELVVGKDHVEYTTGGVGAHGTGVASTRFGMKIIYGSTTHLGEVTHHVANLDQPGPLSQDQRQDLRVKGVEEVIKHLKVSDIPETGVPGTGISKSDAVLLHDILTHHNVDLTQVTWGSGHEEDQIKTILKDSGVDLPNGVSSSHVAYLFHVLNQDTSSPTYKGLYRYSDSKAYDPKVEVPSPEQFRHFHEDQGVAVVIPDAQKQEMQGQTITALAQVVHNHSGEIPVSNDKYDIMNIKALRDLGDNAQSLKDLHLGEIDFSRGREEVVGRIYDQLGGISDVSTRKEVAETVYLLERNPNSYKATADLFKTSDVSLPTREEFRNNGWVGKNPLESLSEELSTAPVTQPDTSTVTSPPVAPGAIPFHPVAPVHPETPIVETVSPIVTTEVPPVATTEPAPAVTAPTQTPMPTMTSTPGMTSKFIPNEPERQSGNVNPSFPWKEFGIGVGGAAGVGAAGWMVKERTRKERSAKEIVNSLVHELNTIGQNSSDPMVIIKEVDRAFSRISLPQRELVINNLHWRSVFERRIQALRSQINISGDDEEDLEEMTLLLEAETPDTAKIFYLLTMMIRNSS